jgi:hypothetical protein
LGHQLGAQVLKDHVVSIIAYATGLLLSLGIILFDGYFFPQIPKYENFIMAFLTMILTFLFETRVQLYRIQVTPRFFATKVPDLSPHVNEFTHHVLEILSNSFRAYDLKHNDLRKVLERHIEEVNKELRDCADGIHRTRAHADNKEDYAINLCQSNYRAVSVGQIAGYWQTAEGKNVMTYCQQAIKNKVKVERIFICDKSHLSGLKKVIENNHNIGVEVSYIDEATLDSRLKRHDFGIVDKGGVAVELVFDWGHNSVNETCFYYDSTQRSKDKIKELDGIWKDLHDHPNRMKYEDIVRQQKNMS